MAIRKGDERSTSEGEAWARLSALAASVGVRQDVGRAEERKARSPESISYETHAQCLLQGMQLSGADEARCWSELQEILGGCSRASEERLQEDLFEPSSASSLARGARARMHFVAALAEWVNVRDLHKRYAMGPPGKEQPCARVDEEF